MKKLLVLFLILTFNLLSVFQSNAQYFQNQPLHMVWEFELNPTQLNKIIQVIKAQNDFYRQKKYPFANFTYYTQDGYLWYTVTFTKYSDIDAIQEIQRDLWRDNPKQMQEFQAMFEGTYKSMGRKIIVEQPELSILPNGSTTMSTGHQFRFIEKFYIKHGKEEIFDSLIRRYVALRKKNRIRAPYYTYYPSFHQNLSVAYCIDELGNSPAEHYSLKERAWEKFGAEGQKLRQDLMQVIEKTETHVGQADYNLTYVPSGIN